MQIDASTYCKCSVEERRRAVGLTIFLPKDHRMERRAYAVEKVKSEPAEVMGPR